MPPDEQAAFGGMETPRKVAVFGGRKYRDALHVFQVLQEEQARRPIGLITVGDGDAAKYAVLWAVLNGVPHKTRQAEWSRYGRAAGGARSRELIAELTPNDLAIAFDGGPGTAFEVKESQRRGVPFRDEQGKKARMPSASASDDVKSARFERQRLMQGATADMPQADPWRYQAPTIGQFGFAAEGFGAEGATNAGFLPAEWLPRNKNRPLPEGTPPLPAETPDDRLLRQYIANSRQDIEIAIESLENFKELDLSEIPMTYLFDFPGLEEWLEKRYGDPMMSMGNFHPPKFIKDDGEDDPFGIFDDDSDNLALEAYKERYKDSERNPISAIEDLERDATQRGIRNAYRVYDWLEFMAEPSMANYSMLAESNPFMSFDRLLDKLTTNTYHPWGPNHPETRTYLHPDIKTHLSLAPEIAHIDNWVGNPYRTRYEGIISDKDGGLTDAEKALNRSLERFSDTAAPDTVLYSGGRLDNAGNLRDFNAPKPMSASPMMPTANRFIDRSYGSRIGEMAEIHDAGAPSLRINPLESEYTFAPSAQFEDVEIHKNVPRPRHMEPYNAMFEEGNVFDTYRVMQSIPPDVAEARAAADQSAFVPETPALPQGLGIRPSADTPPVWNTGPAADADFQPLSTFGSGDDFWKRIQAASKNANLPRSGGKYAALAALLGGMAFGANALFGSFGGDESA